MTRPKSMARWVATRIEMGCDCCSYVAFDSGTGEVPTEYLEDPNVEIDFEEEE